MTIGQMAGLNSFSDNMNAAKSSKLQNEVSKFQQMMEAEASANSGSISSSKISSGHRINGDYTSGFGIENATEADKNTKPQGFAAQSAYNSGKTIDKTSDLYQQSMELENYFVKMMLSSMRNTVNKSSLGGNDSFAGKMYEDMMYDELSVAMTKNAGFGLADQIYLSLAGK